MKKDKVVINASKYIERVILKTSETGIIVKLHQLRDEGFRLAWSGDGQICYEKVVNGGETA